MDLSLPFFNVNIVGFLIFFLAIDCLNDIQESKVIVGKVSCSAKHHSACCHDSHLLPQSKNGFRFNHLVESVRHKRNDHVQVHNLGKKSGEEKDGVEHVLPWMRLVDIRSISTLFKCHHILTPNGVK